MISLAGGQTTTVWIVAVGVPTLLIALLGGFYLLKRCLGSQGWRRTVPGNVTAAIGWVVQRVSRGVGYVGRMVPWKPILIWGPWVVILSVVLFYTIENWRGKRTWQDKRAGLVARGVEMDPWAFLPAEVPDEENFAAHPAVLAQETAKPAVARLMSGGLAGFSTLANSFNSGNPDLGIPEDVGLWLEPSRRVADEREAALIALELMKPVEAQMTGLAEAARLPRCVFRERHVGLEELWTSNLPFTVLELGRAFHDRAILRVRAGQGAAALDDLETQVLMMGHLESDPTMIGGLIRFALLRGISDVVWEGLQARAWSESELERLVEMTKEVEFRKSGLRILRGEWAFLELYYEWSADNRKEFDLHCEPLIFLSKSWAPDWWNDFVYEVGELLEPAVPRGWFYQWLADHWERMDRGVFWPGGVAATGLEPDMLDRLEAEEEALAKTFAGEFRVLWLNSARRFVARSLWGQVEVDLMSIAVALERHRLRTGSYPDDLAALVPTELAVVPVDVMTGQPFTYRIKPDGTPLIYSVGLNGVDDGGVPAREPEALDIVWHYSGYPGQTERQWHAGEKP